MLSGAFPFALGVALALLALWALQAGRRGRFALLTVLVLTASPVAFVLLAVILAGIGLSRAPRRSELVLPLTTLGLAAAVELVLLRLFPAGGRFPFSLPEFAAACVFCGLGIVLTWRVPPPACCAGCTSPISSPARPPTSFRRASARTSRGFVTPRFRSRS